jgi:hypothetical protein
LGCGFFGNIKNPASKPKTWPHQNFQQTSKALNLIKEKNGNKGKTFFTSQILKKNIYIIFK